MHRFDPVEIRFCSGCGGDRLFERPPYADGHGADCPERACGGCGAAPLTGLAGPPPVHVCGPSAQAA